MLGRLLLGVILLCAKHCPADGGYFFRELEAYGTAASADQRAVLVHQDGRETLLIQTRYEGEPGDFAWIVPTPTRVGQGDVVAGAETVFDELARTTAPRAHTKESFGVGCPIGGCASQEGSGGTNSAVAVWDQFSVGDYDVAVLSADDSAELSGWLADNGYNVPATAGPVIQTYSDKDWFFVAVKVRAAVASGSPAPDPDAPRQRMQPLRLTFATDTPVFPMRISAVSTRAQVGVHLYVIAPHRVTGTDYSTGQVRAARPFDPDEEPFDGYYESQLRATVAALGRRSLAVEYAASLSAEQLATIAEPLGLSGSGPYYLTRLSTYLRPEDMTQDIELAYAAADTPFRFEAGASPTAVVTAKGGFAGLWLLGMVLHRRNARRRGAQAALLLATVLVALAV